MFSLSLLSLVLVHLFHLVVMQVPAEPCDPNACKLPDCRCASVDIPGGLPSHQIPQIVTISFDDGFRLLDYQNYYEPIFSGRKNPNGCPIGLTFFNSHHYTDYSLVEHAHYDLGSEFASHSVSHRLPSTWWRNASEEELEKEIEGQRQILSTWGGISRERIRGFRAPFLVTSENELKVLHDNKFLYDASMTTSEPYWPFTLDYKSPLCNAPATCPVHAYPGLWVIPHQVYSQSNGFPCGMIDACTAPFTEDQWLGFLTTNFFDHYNTTRSPFGIYAHAAWFQGWLQRQNAMKQFLDMIGDMDDVYVVTQSQMLEWVRHPTPLSSIDGFSPWLCPPSQGPRCDFNSPTCQKVFTDPFYINFRSCSSSCPDNYPSVGNPLGL